MSERPSLTEDRWMPVDESEEFSRIRNAALADLNRASRGIASVARILHNSLGDDLDDECRSGIDDFTKQNLAGAVECLSDFIYHILENESFGAHQIKKLEQEVPHG
jgi:hypothetical protein